MDMIKLQKAKAWRLRQIKSSKAKADYEKQRLIWEKQKRQSDFLESLELGQAYKQLRRQGFKKSQLIEHQWKSKKNGITYTVYKNHGLLQAKAILNLTKKI